MTDLTLQIARDHLVMCQGRLAEARRSIGRATGSLDGAFATIVAHESKAAVLQALDFVWEAQERTKGDTYFGTGAITAEEALDIVLERGDRGDYAA